MWRQADREPMPRPRAATNRYADQNRERRVSRFIVRGALQLREGQGFWATLASGAIRRRQPDD